MISTEGFRVMMAVDMLSFLRIWTERPWSVPLSLPSLQTVYCPAKLFNISSRKRSQAMWFCPHVKTGWEILHMLIENNPWV